MPTRSVNSKLKMVNGDESIYHSLFTIHNLPGYTLVEFLIVIGILAASMGSLLLFMTSVIKGANQTNIVSEVKQNGQAVLENLERQIRSSTDVRPLAGTELLGTNNSGIVLTVGNGGQVSIICLNAVGISTPDPLDDKNGWIGIAKTTNPPTGIFPPNDSLGYQALTNNTSIQSGVDINCYPNSTYAFQVNPSASSAKIVSVNFIANQGVAAPSRADFLANAQFRTTVSIRKYN